jgi:hypothetical protein
MSTKRASEYSVPALALVLGLIGWIVAAIGGQGRWGILIFGIMALYALVLLAGGRFAVTRVLAGRPADEREQSFDLRATAFAGVVVIACIIGGFFYELAAGRSGEPFVWLGTVAGLSYLVAVIWLRWRA